MVLHDCKKDLQHFKKRATRSFETSEIANPAKQRQIPEDRNPSLHPLKTKNSRTHARTRARTRPRHHAIKHACKAQLHARVVSTKRATKFCAPAPNTDSTAKVKTMRHNGCRILGQSPFWCLKYGGGALILENSCGLLSISA